MTANSRWMMKEPQTNFRNSSQPHCSKTKDDALCHGGIIDGILQNLYKTGAHVNIDIYHRFTADSSWCMSIMPSIPAMILQPKSKPRSDIGSGMIQNPRHAIVCIPVSVGYLLTKLRTWTFQPKGKKDN